MTTPIVVCEFNEFIMGSPSPLSLRPCCCIERKYLLPHTPDVPAGWLRVSVCVCLPVNKSLSGNLSDSFRFNARSAAFPPPPLLLSSFAWCLGLNCGQSGGFGWMIRVHMEMMMMMLVVVCLKLYLVLSSARKVFNNVRVFLQIAKTLSRIRISGFYDHQQPPPESHEKSDRISLWSPVRWTCHQEESLTGLSDDGVEFKLCGLMILLSIPFPSRRIFQL